MTTADELRDLVHQTKGMQETITQMSKAVENRLATVESTQRELSEQFRQMHSTMVEQQSDFNRILGGDIRSNQRGLYHEVLDLKATVSAYPPPVRLSQDMDTLFARLAKLEAAYTAREQEETKNKNWVAGEFASATIRWVVPFVLLLLLLGAYAYMNAMQASPRVAPALPVISSPTQPRNQP